ncbi:MAG TPA: acyltransferase family protein, partial [Nocardioidaceae bacterium]|nr:acyltransferase family protein [Nocardioidaceae bacterium]
FEGLLAAFRVWVGGEELEGIWLDPHWAMWFLAALALWRLVTPVLRAMPAALPVAVVVCLLGGLTTGDVLDVARVMGFLPFFTLGLLARPEHVALLRRPGARLTSAGVLLVAAALAPWFSPRVSAEWLYWRASYAELERGFVEGAAGRLGLLVLSTVLALCVLSLMPTSARWFTPLGAASLVVYLCHGFLVKGAEYAGLGDVLGAWPLDGLLVTSLFGVGVALALAAPQVARRLDVLVDPVPHLRNVVPGGRRSNQEV